MPTFKPRTTEEILNDAINYVHYNTTLTDFNVGSVIRTILEAMAIEDADQYSQIANILNSFFLKNVFGQQLDDRAAEYGVARKFPSASVGEVVFIDTELQRSFLVKDTVPGNTLVYVQDISQFPESNFIVQLGEGTSFEEQVQIASVNSTNQTLVVDTTATAPFNEVTYTHSAAIIATDEIDNVSSLVCLVSGSPSRVIPAGVTMRAKPTNSTFSIEAVTKETSVISNGNYKSDSIKVVTTTLGQSSNIPPKRLNQIVGSPPFSGASVINVSSISGGRNIESDDDLKGRIAQHIAGLAAGTDAAVFDAALTVSDPVTNKRVERVSLLHSTDENILYVYIDDGSTSEIAETQALASDTLKEELAVDATKLRVESISGFPVASLVNPKYILINALGKNSLEPYIVKYTGVDGDYLTGLDPVPKSVYPVGTSVNLVEIVDSSTELNRKYYFLDNSPITEDEPVLAYTNSVLGNATKLNRLVPGEIQETTHDFILNKSNGQIEMLKNKNLPEGSFLVCAYENFTGLVQLAQRTLDGDLNNASVFPGVRSAGVQLLVRPTNKTSIDITMDITIDSSITDMDTASFLARQFTISYINSLGIGEHIILAEIIERVMTIDGITNVKITTPEDDITMLHSRAPYANLIIVN